MKLLTLLLFFIICVSPSCELSIPFVYLKYFKKRAIDIIDKAGPKDDCSRHLKAWIGDLFNVKKLWALQMLDASAKPQTGFLTGNIMHLGNYDECLKITEDKGNHEVIEGQYCTVALLPVKNATSDIAMFFDIVNFFPNVMGIEEGREVKESLKILKIFFGICFPKSCSAENVQKLWDYIEYTFRLPVHVTLNANFCSNMEKGIQDFYFDKYIICAFGLFFFGICLATVYDIIISNTLKETTQSLWEKIFTSFSIHKNLQSIFHYSPDNVDNTLSCINGLKVLSMLWVIFGHRHIFGFMSGIINMTDYFEWRKSPVALIVLLAPFAVDNFLTISGLLLAFKYMEIRDLLAPNKSMPYIMFYFFRFLRLWPALIAVILALTSILKYLNSGPLWTMLAYKMSSTCSSTGWLTALFLSNMVEFKYQCLEPAWYLAVDTQLYCIAPILLYVLYKYPKWATLVFISVSLMSALYAFRVTINSRIKWNPSDGDERYMKLYQSTFFRLPSWFLGILTGALLYNFQLIRIPKVLNIIIWITITLIFLGIARVTNLMTNSPYNSTSAALYNALARLSWSIAICLLIFLCCTGHGGIINKILSFRIYSVIVKFSYSTYLVHLTVIILVGGHKRTTAFFNSFTNLHAFLGDLPFIFATSVIWCLAFESPFINIAKILNQSGSMEVRSKKRLTETSWKNKAVVKFFSKKKQFNTRKNK